MRQFVFVAVLVTGALAGCIEGASVDPVDRARSDAPRVSLDGVAWGPAVRWDGGELTAENGWNAPFGLWPLCTAMNCWTPPACEESNCERVPFHVDPGAESVQVRVQGQRNYTLGVFVTVYDEAGEAVAYGKTTDWLSIAVLEDPAPGAYVAEVLAGWGAGSYEGAIVVHQPLADAGGEPRDLLPDLVTIRPSDLRVETPSSATGLPGAMPAAKGCAWEESLEAMARRCLRFSNGVANVGEGPLEVRLAQQDALLSLAGQGRFVQIVYASDGSTREELVGSASFHAAHRHYHYAGLATYTLHEYDETTKTRGAQVGEGRKAGFCFYDTAMVDLTRADVGPQRYDGSGCFNVEGDGESWYTGVSPGFTDFYGWYLADQFVEITGLPDGVYELETVADGGASLVETDTSNNAATAVFRLSGDDVEVLWTTGA